MTELKAEMIRTLRDYGQGLFEVDEEDFKFDVEAAIYWFANDWHNGQFTDLYSILSTSPYKPGILTACAEDVGEVCGMLYNILLGVKFVQQIAQ